MWSRTRSLSLWERAASVVERVRAGLAGQRTYPSRFCPTPGYPKPKAYGVGLRKPGRIGRPLIVEIIAFDGDDTLWHNETLFSVTQEKFRHLLRPYVAEADIDASLYATEIRNLALFGYGIKGFTLSMIETAIEISGGQVTAADIQTLIDHGKGMLDHPVELLDGVPEIVESLRHKYRIMVITKGDLFDQESKIARSGLADLFWKIEIVSEKDPASYRRILQAHDIAAEGFLMVGNSVKSDILPVLEIGGRAVHIPYHVTWAHEVPDPDADPLAAITNTYRTLDSILELPALLRDLADDS